MHSGDRAGIQLEAPISLFEISNYDPGNPSAIFRFTNDYNVTFNLNSYQAIGAFLEPLPIQSEGSIGVATLTAIDTNGILSTLYRQYRLDNATLKAFKTDARFLNQTNSLKVRSLAIYRISHAEEVEPKNTLKLILNPRIADLDRTHGRQMTSFCQATYKDGITCPYAGALGSCAKRLSDCKARFGNNVRLPFMGLPIGLGVEQAQGWGI